MPIDWDVAARIGVGAVPPSTIPLTIQEHWRGNGFTTKSEPKAKVCDPGYLGATIQAIVDKGVRWEQDGCQLTI
jgi:hypothetical protein